MRGTVTAYARHRRAKGLPGGSLRAVQKARDRDRINFGLDGMIDFDTADRDWEANTYSVKRHMRPTPPTAPEPEGGHLSDYQAGLLVGRAETAHHLCGNMRTALAELLAGAQFESLSPEEALVERVLPLALVVYLMEAWTEDQLSDAKALGLKPLPAIAWRGLFGSAAREAKACFEKLQAYWRTEEDAPMPEVQPGKAKAPSQRRNAAKRSSSS